MIKHNFLYFPNILDLAVSCYSIERDVQKQYHATLQNEDGAEANQSEA